MYNLCKAVRNKTVKGHINGAILQNYPGNFSAGNQPSTHQWEKGGEGSVFHIKVFHY